MRIAGVIVVGWAAWAIAGCASGSSDLDGETVDQSGGGGSPATTTTTTTTTTGAGGGGGEGGAGAGGGGGGQVTNCDFDAPLPCTISGELPQIKGDDGNDVRTETGTTSKWFHVYVEESVSDLFSYPDLSYTVTLSYPQYMDYDLYVYTGSTSGPNCAASSVKGTGAPEQVHDSWNDSAGSEDGTWITIEVRYVSGDSCTAADGWTLTVAGNT